MFCMYTYGSSRCIIMIIMKHHHDALSWCTIMMPHHGRDDLVVIVFIKIITMHKIHVTRICPEPMCQHLKTHMTRVSQPICQHIFPKYVQLVFFL